jgi:predicted nucleic acid-binding protein
MIGIMKILLDADILLEAVLDRNMFIDEIEKLFEILTLNKIEIFISELGLSRINSTMKIFNTSRKMTGVFFKVKKPLKKLKITERIAQKAKLLAVNDFESAVEISLAIEANIGAIITHKPDDFSGGEFNILTLTDFQQRHKMEVSASGDTNELLARWTIPLEKLFNLNKILDRSPSYTDIKSLKLNESTSQLDITSSSDKVSTSSTDKLSPQSTNARSINRIIIDAFLNPSSERLTCKSSLDTLRASIERNQLSIKSSDRSTAYIDIMISTGRSVAHIAYESPFEKVRKIMLQAERVSSLVVDSLSIRPPVPQPIRQLESSKIGGIAATALQAHRKLLGGKLMKDIFPSVKASSLVVDSLSIRPPVPQPIRQLESSEIGGIAATALQAHKTLIDTLKERIDRSSQLNPLSKVDRSFSDRAGLLSQIELLESMQRANTLDSYLSRKN